MSMKFLMLLLLGIMTLSLNSCKKDNDAPANVITDDGGLSITLTWTAADGSNPTTTNNLDLYLFLDATGAAYTSVTNGFEGITIPANHTIPELRVEVYFVKADKNGTFNLTFTGINSGKKYEVSQAFTISDEGNGKDVVKFNKAGNTFTITNM